MTTQLQSKMPSMGHRFGGGKDRFAPKEKPKNAKGTLRRIIHIYMQWGKSIFVAVLLTAIASVLAVLIPYFIGRAFDTFQIKTLTVDTVRLIKILLLIGILHGLNWGLNASSGWLMLRISQKLVRTLRSEFFSKMQRLPLDFYDTRSHGDTMSRITNDVDNISSTISQTTTQLISSILTLSGAFIVMITLSIPLTIAVMTGIPLVAILTNTIARKSRKYFLEQQRNLGTLSGMIEENILGLKLVKAFNKKGDAINRFTEVNERLCKSSTKAQIWSGYMMPMMNVINNLVFTEVAILGGFLSVKGSVSIGVVVSMLSYAKQFTQPLNSIAGMFSTIQSALAGAERVFEILDQEEEVPDHPDGVEMKTPVGRVEFQGIEFSYDKKHPVVQDISFHVEPGEVIALVGETGAGKTTLVNLLTRFYDPDRGEIRIDGVPVQKIRRNSLRHCFSVVLQDTCLFSGTIAENIKYSNPKASAEEVIRAAKIARAHEFVSKLPNGYETIVSASNDNLSQGQRQLIAIARAVLSDSPILILDEATSSVDTKTEKEIQKALVNLMKNRTSFLIAHRLSTIRDADRIFVIEKGGICESGNHESLMEKKGSYYRMVMSQLGLEEEDGNNRNSLLFS